MIKNIKWLLLVSLTFVACNSNDDTTAVSNSSDGLPLTAGTADFSKYVALGNSLTAGYSDGTLFIEGQKGSWTNVLSQQFALVGGGDFKIPYMADNVGGFKIGGTVFQGPRLYFNGVGPVPVAGTPSTEITNHLTGPFNNMGVPGAKSFHLLAPNYGNPAGLATGASNPFFVRFASTPSATILGDAMAQAPTFFTLWIGNNDVLSYATTGGIGTNQTGNLNPATYGGNDITDPNVFASVYSTLINTLTSNGAKGAVSNIPYVTSVPFFTTVPYNPIPLAAANVAALNSPGGYGNYNLGLIAAKNAGLITDAERLQRTINFVVGKNAPVIVDEYLTPVNVPGLVLPKYRQATALDYIVLSSGGVSAQANFLAGGGTSVPLADNWVLSKNEVAEVRTATDAYNATIQSIATSKGLAIVDANSILFKIANGGVLSNNFLITSAYVTGGGFSLDGVHPSARGYALIANEFMKAINTTYGSNLKGVDVGTYRIQYPSSL